MKLIFRLFFFGLTFVGCKSDDNSTYKTVVLKASTIDDQLFISSENWGLTGDSQITTISSSKPTDFKQADPNQYYIFHGLNPFLYKVSGDSLLIYTQSIVPIPNQIKTKWTIVQNKVDNSAFLTLMADTVYRQL